MRKILTSMISTMLAIAGISAPASAEEVVLGEGQDTVVIARGTIPVGISKSVNTLSVERDLPEDTVVHADVWPSVSSLRKLKEGEPLVFSASVSSTVNDEGECVLSMPISEAAIAFPAEEEVDVDVWFEVPDGRAEHTITAISTAETSSTVTRNASPFRFL